MSIGMFARPAFSSSLPSYLTLGALPSFPALSTLRSLRALTTGAAARSKGIVVAIHLGNAAAVTLSRRDVLDAATDALITLLVIANITKERLAVAFLHGYIVINSRLRANLGDSGTAGAEVGIERIEGSAEDGRVRKEDAGSGLGVDVVGSKGTAIRVLGNVDLGIMVSAEYVALGLGRHGILGRESRAAGRRRAACNEDKKWRLIMRKSIENRYRDAKSHAATGLAALKNSIISSENGIGTGCQNGDGSNRGRRDLHGWVCIFGNRWKMSFRS